MSEVIDLARGLINRPSVSPVDGGCQEVIRDRLQNKGFDIVDLSQGDTTNTWAVRRFGDGPLLTFVGHTDVVPEGDRGDWNTDPFRLCKVGFKR